MLKFEGFGRELGVISFSRVRPKSLSVDVVLRLKARSSGGKVRQVCVSAQEKRLRKIGGALTQRRAFR